ncbi:MAG: Xaa-Pro peptidase family protein [Planctomycetota bacterium]|nr:Xaa-Pro peptidase family protein [Planctomycetota bacterium]
MSNSESNRLAPELIRACKSRQSRVRQQFEDQGIDGFLVTSHHDIQYLTDFVGDESWVLVHGDGLDFVTDTRYEEELKAWEGTGVGNPFMGIRHRLPVAVTALCQERGIKRLGIQAEYVSIASGNSLREALHELEVVETTAIISSLRTIKDAPEIEQLEKALRLQEQALRMALGALHMGMTEYEFAAELVYRMIQLGARESSFGPIIASGAGSAIPHYLPQNVKITEGTLLIDWGAYHGWYSGDLTRTYGVVTFPEKIKEIYPIVLEAQMSAIEAIAPGVVCAEIDAVARKVITDAGYGEYFNHGLGHGLGIEVHEGPYFNNLETDVVLKPGMVLTVEPGIYLSGVGGVRIEDDIVVTENGCRVLSDFPKDIESAVIEPATSGAIA